ncbi:MAG: hypothetical protein RL323_1630 [Pseudomonadota bacterium]|jgi:signal transduction histidine kinase
MSPRNNSKGYWLLMAATISVLPFFLFAGYSIVQLVQSKQQDLQRQMIDRSQATANAVAERLASSSGALRALATSDAVAKGDLASVYAQAKRTVQEMPDISAISMVTPDGQVQFLTLLPFGKKTFLAGDQDTVRLIFETGKPMVSEPFPSPIDNTVTITSLGVPAFRDGEVAYVIRAIFRNSSLNSLLAAQHLPSEWSSAILSRTGLIEARSPSPEQFVGKPATPAVMEALPTQRNNVFSATTREGVATQAVAVAVPGWDLYVLMEVPSSEFKEPLVRAIVFLGIFGLATLVLGGIIVSWLVFLVQKPGDRTVFDTSSTLNKVASIWPSAVALGVALVIGGFGTYVSQNALHEIDALTSRRQSIYQERRQLAELLSAYKDIEAGQRGFIITGAEAFLEPYKDALPRIPALTNALKSGLDRLDITTFSWTDLAHFSSLRLGFAAKGIELRRQEGASVMEDLELFGSGKMYMDKLRLMLGNLESQLEVETQRINTAIAEQESKTLQLQWLSQFAVGTLVILSISIWLYERRRRQGALNQLQHINETLEDRVLTRTQELSLASARIRNFALETETIIDNERKRLSREVHDQIGQIFTGLKMIAKTLKPGSLAEDQSRAMMAAIESGVKISRRIAAELRPPLLDDFGIRVALDHYLKTTFEPLEIAFDLQFPERSRLSPPQMNQLFRMVQEACTNIVRHAHAQQVEVIGQLVQTGLEVRIEDDGVGFEAHQVRTDALGLIGIKERAKLSGATVSVQPREGGGTRISIHFPEEALQPEVSS